MTATVAWQGVKRPRLKGHRFRVDCFQTVILLSYHCRTKPAPASKASGICGGSSDLPSRRYFGFGSRFASALADSPRTRVRPRNCWRPPYHRTLSATSGTQIRPGHLPKATCLSPDFSPVTRYLRTKIVLMLFALSEYLPVDASHTRDPIHPPAEPLLQFPHRSNHNSLHTPERRRSNRASSLKR